MGNVFEEAQNLERTIEKFDIEPRRPEIVEMAACPVCRTWVGWVENAQGDKIPVQPRPVVAVSLQGEFLKVFIPHSRDAGTCF